MTMPRDVQGMASEVALMARVRQGDGAAASELARLVGPVLFGVAMRLLGNRAEAEDVVQEALLRLWRVAPDWDLEGGAKPSTWAVTVLRNLCIDRMRRARGGVALEAVPEPVDALRRLPERQRQAVALRHLEGLGNPEIAGIMDLSVEAVESLTARGKRALKAALAGRRSELGFEDDQT